jgi:DNA repair protein SbcD/Mre11
MRFAHLGDCHLGSWKQPELQDINFLCFQQAINKCIEEQLDFVLIAGDLFDSAYPPVEILKLTFREFRKLHDAKIPVFMIAGSHDYSVSGKTFLDVLEKAGFCEMCKYEEIKNEKNEVEKIILNTINFKGIEICGYPGKKSGLEVDDLKKVEVPNSNSDNFRILMLHTSVTEAIGSLPINSISLEDVPKADYYAMAHLHIDFNHKTSHGGIANYSGPIFPNSFQELEDIGRGSYYIVEIGGFTNPQKQELRLKQVLPFKIEITNSLTGTQQIINELEKQDIQDKIILLRLHGVLEQGTNADIDYTKIKEYLEQKKVYSFLKNTNKLSTKQDIEKPAIQIDEANVSKIEQALIKEYEEKNPDKFNTFILPLTHALELEKQEDEKTAIYESRLLSEVSKVLGVEMK